MNENKCKKIAALYVRFSGSRDEAEAFAIRARTDGRLRGEAIKRLRDSAVLARELRLFANERFFREFHPDWQKNVRLLENYDGKREFLLQEKAESFRIFDEQDQVVAVHEKDVFSGSATRGLSVQRMRKLVSYNKHGVPHEILPEEEREIFWGGKKTVAIAVNSDYTISFICRDKENGWTVQTEKNQFGRISQIKFISDYKAVGLNERGVIVVWEKDSNGKMRATQSFEGKYSLFSRITVLPDETIVAETAGWGVSFIKPDEMGKYHETEGDYLRFPESPTQNKKDFLICGADRFCVTFADGSYKFIRKSGPKEPADNWEPFGEFEISRLHHLSGKDEDCHVFRVLPNGVMFCEKDLIVRGGLPKKDIVVGGIEELSGEFRARYMHHCLGTVTVTALADDGVLLQDNRNLFVEWHAPGGLFAVKNLILWADSGVPVQIAENGEIYIAEKDGTISIYGNVPNQP